MALSASARGWLALGAAFGGLALVGYLARVAGASVSPRRRRNPWRTLSNRRRVHVDDAGRLDRGLPETFRGVHVRDVSRLSKRLRRLDREEAKCARTRKGVARFKTAKEYARALFEANPDLENYVQENWGGDSQAFVEGRKVALGRGDGRFDFVNEPLGLKGRARVSSWAEAIRRIAPPSRRWSDTSRLGWLSDGVGFEVQPPAHADALGETRADCARQVDHAIRETVTKAKTGRLTAPRRARAVLAEAPF
jgi:hypothetical protein